MGEYVSLRGETTAAWILPCDDLHLLFSDEVHEKVSRHCRIGCLPSLHYLSNATGKFSALQARSFAYWKAAHEKTTDTMSTARYPLMYDGFRWAVEGGVRTYGETRTFFGRHSGMARNALVAHPERHRNIPIGSAKQWQLGTFNLLTGSQSASWSKNRALFASVIPSISSILPAPFRRDSVDGGQSGQKRPKRELG